MISSGIYGYPKDQALHIAFSAISQFLFTSEANVYLVLFDKKAITLSEKLFSAIEQYIDDNYVDEHLLEERSRVIEHYVVYNSGSLSQDSKLFSARRSIEDVLDQKKTH